MIRRVPAMLAAGILAVTGAAVVPSPARGAGGPNAVVAWNTHAQNAVFEVARQAPHVAPRSFAMVQGAVYDAANAIAGTPYEPYLTAPRARRTDSTDAAVAAAAYRVLRSLFPEQAATLDATYAAELAKIPDGRSKVRGVAVGEQAAATMITARIGDGVNGPGTWNVSTAPGHWRPSPPTNGSDGAWVGDLKPFVIADPGRYRTAGPPALSSSRWTRDFIEVKALGGVDSTVRTADQTEAAIWWHDRRLTEWEIKRQVAQTRQLSTLQTARMFAMADVANADSLIACFAEKKHWSFWRPVTAVREAGSDGNPATVADPAWTPLLVTPPSPDYTSGHTCSTATILYAMRAFFGRDDIPFSAYSADSGTVRHFAGFSAALDEVVEARIWGGVHYREADVQGVRIGDGVAREVLAREFRRR